MDDVAEASIRCSVAFFIVTFDLAHSSHLALAVEGYYFPRCPDFDELKSWQYLIKHEKSERVLETEC